MDVPYKTNFVSFSQFIFGPNFYIFPGENVTIHFAIKGAGVLCSFWEQSPMQILKSFSCPFLNFFGKQKKLHFLYVTLVMCTLWAG